MVGSIEWRAPLSGGHRTGILRLMCPALRTAGGVVIATLALASCATGTWTGDPGDPHVAVVGDSLIAFSENGSLTGTETLITDDLVAAGTRAWVTGWTGAGFAWAYEDLWNLPAREGVTPDVLVLALGTNDMHIPPGGTEPLTSVEAVRPVVAAWLAEVPNACVRLIGPAESITGWGLDVTAPPFNAMLAEEAALHADAEYVAWNPDPAWTENGANPHVTPAGRAAYRALIVAEALACLGL